jgi:excisionase family DNA binding protein
MNKPSEDTMAPKPTTSRSSSAGPTATTSTDSDVMTLAEAAAFLKCDPATVKRQAKVLRMPHKRVGALWRFYRPALIAWMQDDEAA